jgi:cytochrome d ubiquinol oxidase subunit II
MAELWFWLVAVLLTGWAVLDGFDFGVGVLHRFVARTDAERQESIGAIGPVWDANEVWLLAAGGSMLLAFPRLLAAGFSGLYLPVVFVVWGLIVRGVSLELRSHLSDRLWRSFFDTLFVLASVLVPVLMGTALGNVVRGVPLRADGFFELPLFASDGPLGVIDPFTLWCGVTTLLVLTAHGSAWLAWRASGEVSARALRLRRPLWLAAMAAWLSALGGTTLVARDLLEGAVSRPLAWVGLIGALTGFALTQAPGSDRRRFLGGSGFIAGVLVAVVASLFPTVLRATDPAMSLTITNASSQGRSMSDGLFWWAPGIMLAATWLWWVLRHFRAKEVPVYGLVK